eukprot:TRINITY_DN14000_c0_g1_i1.p1 TRINITY_DN14000_c0_g1~~TRINITY_DN14000_c0_g1_i1.p1  ORF type:complete len:270 (-),score=53.76 TRINITY_DN14000_c0_g1_i1:35-823(-)
MRPLILLAPRFKLPHLLTIEENLKWKEAKSRIDNLCGLEPHQRNRQSCWEELFEIFKLVEEISFKCLDVSFRANELYKSMMEFYLSKSQETTKSKELTSQCPSSDYVWDWSLLGRDVLSIVFSYISVDDGNWLSLLMVNKFFYGVMKEQLNPTTFIYGLRPIQYSIKRRQLQSLRSLLKDDRVDLTGIKRSPNEPKLLPTEFIPAKEIFSSGWKEGWIALMESGRFNWEDYEPRVLEKRILSEEEKEMQSSYLFSVLPQEIK